MADGGVPELRQTFLYLRAKSPVEPKSWRRIASTEALYLPVKRREHH